MTRIGWILAVLLSHWRRHPMQLATLLIGLISATALWSGVQALNLQARTSYDRAAATFGGARTAMLVGRTATFPQALYVDLRRAGGGARQSAILQDGVGTDPGGKRDARRSRLDRGCDPDGEWRHGAAAA